MTILDTLRGKGGTITTTTTPTTHGRPWERPTWTMPELLDGRKLKPLGEHRGRHYYAHAGYELAERGLIDENRDILPDGPVLQEGPGMYRAFEVLPPGSFARLSAGIVRPPRPPKPTRPVDALGFVFLAERQPERIVARAALTPASPGGVLAIKEGAPPARGAESILARLASRGATVTLSMDRAYLVVSCADGRPGPGVVELVDTARPLLLAHLQGTPLRCSAGKHKGEAPEAVSLAVGGAPICQACLDGAS